MNSLSTFNSSSKSIKSIKVVFGKLIMVSLFRMCCMSSELFMAAINVRVVLASSLIWYSILLLIEVRSTLVIGETSSEIDIKTNNCMIIVYSLNYFQKYINSEVQVDYNIK